MQPTQPIEPGSPDVRPWSGYRDPVGECLRLEHAAIARQLAVLQQRLGDQLAEQLGQLSRLERDNVRLRAELVRTRTAVLWGLHAAAVTTPPRRPAIAPKRPPTPVERRWDAAQAFICQTGCSGHGHPWLDEGGQCRRTGTTCQPLEKAGDGLSEIEARR